MNGQTLVKAFIPLPGQASAVYTNSGLDHYRHSDWLGSARLTSSPIQTYTSSVAYAPFGETYAQSGAADPSFTGQNPDTMSTDYDFLFREYSIQGRWPAPDPSGLASMHLRDPQTLNRYAYVRNNPLALVDPQGLDVADECGDDSGDCGDGGILGEGGGGGCTDPSCGSDNGSRNDPNNPDPSSGDPSNSGSNCTGGDASCGGNQGGQSQFNCAITYPDAGGGCTTGSLNDLANALNNLPLGFDDQKIQTLSQLLTPYADAMNNPLTYAEWFGLSAGLGGLGATAGASYNGVQAIYYWGMANAETVTEVIGGFITPYPPTTVPAFLGYAANYYLSSCDNYVTETCH